MSLAALAAFLFRDALFRGRVLYERDIHVFFYAQAASFARCLAAGSWPVWNPWSGFGRPLLASPHAQVLYPWTWLSLIVSPGVFYTIYAPGHLFFAGTGLYLLGRRLGISVPGSLTAAVLWMTSGPLLSMVSLWHHYASATWIPWVLFAADGALSLPSLGWTLALALANTGQILAGSADTCAMTGLLVAAYALRYVQWHGGLAATSLRIARTLLLAWMVALALSAAVWMPGLDLLALSSRAGFSESVRELWSLSPPNLLQWLLPLFPQNLPLKTAYRAQLFEGREPFLNSVYMGLGALPFVAAAFTPGRRRLAGILAGAGTVAALLALGRHTFAYPMAIALVPPVRIFRYPSKTMIIVSIVWALLAGLGFDAWRQPTDRPPRPPLLALLTRSVLVAAVAALALLALSPPERWALGFLDADRLGPPVTSALLPLRITLLATALAATAVALLDLARKARGGRGRGLAYAAAFLAAADLLFAHRDLNPTAPPELFFRPPQFLSLLNREEPTRLYVFDYLVRVVGKNYRRPELQDPSASSEPSSDLRKALVRQDYPVPPAAERWGLYSSYEFDATGLDPRPLQNLSLFLRATEETPGFARLLRIGGVSHVMSLHTVGLEDLQPRASWRSAFTPMVHLFQVPGSLPRAYAVDGARRADGLAALQALVDPGFDPQHEIVVEGPPRPWNPTFSGAARFLELLPDRLRIQAGLNAPGYVVVVDAYDPGWRATVDGQEAPLLRANVAFRAVPVPAGPHEIELEYRPRALMVGLLVSSIASFATVMLAAPLAFGRRRGESL